MKKVAIILPLVGLALVALIAINRQSSARADTPTTLPAGRHTNEEWKKVLSAETYHVMFEAGTERPFSNAYYDNHEPGTYVSAATGVVLFSSKDKYDSGTGWPSFTQPVTKDAVIIRSDADGSGRDEVIDASSGGHLGHVFDDGPAPTGKRFCMNSAAMKFIPEKK